MFIKRRKIYYIEHTVTQLSVCFSDIMVWEVVTPAVPPRDPKHQNMKDSEPQGEHTGSHEAAEFTHVYCRIADTTTAKQHYASSVT